MPKTKVAGTEYEYEIEDCTGLLGVGYIGVCQKGPNGTQLKSEFCFDRRQAANAIRAAIRNQIKFNKQHEDDLRKLADWNSGRPRVLGNKPHA